MQLNAIKQMEIYAKYHPQVISLIQGIPFRNSDTNILNYFNSETQRSSYSNALPKGSYYFFPRFVKEQKTEQFCMDLLYNANVAVVPGNDFGLGGENHIRLCFGRNEEDIKKGMELITDYIRSMRQ